jgi:5-methylcytosine-specific restriction protein B
VVRLTLDFEELGRERSRNLKKADLPGLSEVYWAADLWVSEALKADGSLFVPGSAVWIHEGLTDLQTRLLGLPVDSRDPFVVKVVRELADAPRSIIQLMAEVLFIHLLVAWKGSIGPDRKRELMDSILALMPDDMKIPPRLDAALEVGLASTGIAFLSYRRFQVTLLVRFVAMWKGLPATLREEALADPWRFKELVFAVHERGANAQREALLHFAHPQTFEAIVSQEHKERIANTFAHLIRDEEHDVDRQLLAIREKLADTYGEGFSFYRQELQEQWQPSRDEWVYPTPLY